jgi:hypothetical protein
MTNADAEIVRLLEYWALGGFDAVTVRALIEAWKRPNASGSTNGGL